MDRTGNFFSGGSFEDYKSTLTVTLSEINMLPLKIEMKLKGGVLLFSSNFQLMLISCVIYSPVPMRRDRLSRFLGEYPNFLLEVKLLTFLSN